MLSVVVGLLSSLLPVDGLQASAENAGAAFERTTGEPPARLVIVRRSDKLFHDQRRFVEGLSLSGLVGLPLCLLAADELTPIQRELFVRLPGLDVVCVGEPPVGIPAGIEIRQVAEVAELLPPSKAVVLTTQHFHDQLEAAVEACRRRLPLVVTDRSLGGRLKALGVESVHVYENRHKAWLPPGHELEVRQVGNAAARLRAAGAAGRPYLAVGNAGATRSYGTGSLVGAAALAAAHGGVLHLIDEKVVFDYATLRRRSAPEELEDHPAKGWLTGAFDLGSDEILIAVPQVDEAQGIGAMVPKWGDPIVDLDRDGVLEPETETIEIGTVHPFEGRDWSLSLRLIGALGMTKFKDSMRTERAVRIAPAAETIAVGLQQLYREAGVRPAALLIAGDHREVPFDYVKDPVYADSTMQEQELASDNCYADPDGDGYLDLPVGRFVSSGFEQASALAARLASRPHWRAATAKPKAALIYPAWADDEIDLQMPMIFPSFEALHHGLAADLERAGFALAMHLREAGAIAQALPALADSGLIVFSHHSGPDSWQFRVHKPDGDWRVEELVPRNRESRDGVSAVPPLTAAPLIVGAGCDSAGLDYEVVFGASIVHTFFERGALGYLGNTRAGFPDTEEFLLRHCVQAALGLAPGTAGPLPVGEAFRQAKNYLDLLIRERGPFRCVEPFENYALAMRREWNSLVYYGDPLLRLVPAETVPRPTVALRAFDGDGRVELSTVAELGRRKIWFMAEVGVGPLHEVEAVFAPGLSYSSVPWALYGEIAKPAIVGPGCYVDLAIPSSVRGERVALVEGPEWALGGSRIVKLANGNRRLLLSVDLVRYAMQRPDDAERADRVVLELR
ncbi:MAG: C25 family cysteine peptidase [bacterium]|nr:C25 family cysteine peptidase [bacterium]